MVNRTPDLEFIIESFERAFKHDPAVNFAEFAPAADSEVFLEVVTELIRTDMELSWASDRQKTIEDYARMFPDVFRDAQSFDQIAFEEYRLRVSCGEDISPIDYQQRHSIKTWHWPVLVDSAPDSIPLAEFFARQKKGVVGDPQNATRPDLAGRLVAGQLASIPTVEGTLQKRLRFIGLVISTTLLYLSFLAWANPVDKVGLFLGSRWLLWINGFCLLLSIGICVLLWVRKRIPLHILRTLELILFGSVLAELAVGLSSDLFIDQELTRPISEGEHELFHYASSWSLPFFALIVAYGTLVPSSWRRCTVVVSVMGLTPILICTIAALVMHGISVSFFKSFLLQMIIWMATGAGIAIYGVRRLEENQFRLMRSGKLGKYRLIRQIAKGGMGEVFLAEHALMNRRCAIKLMHSRWLLDKQLLRRFEREVQVLAGVSHPNVVQVYDFGFTNDGAFYYVMEYLEGSTLDEVVKRDGPLSCKRAVEILLQVADALAVIHQGGIVHRDVKPSNIFLSKNTQGETVKLLDFGLIKTVSRAESEEQITQDGAILGTPAYMSPEQAAGYRVDHRTDLYSLGAVAYFALSGGNVFERATAVETLNAHIHAAPDPIRDRNERVQDPLQEILHRCLSKDPAGRYSSAQELSKALQDCNCQETFPKPGEER